MWIGFTLIEWTKKNFNEEKRIILIWIKLSYTKKIEQEIEYPDIKLNEISQIKLDENYKNEEREEK